MLQEILAKLAPKNAQLVAVSKRKPIAAIQAFYEQGQRAFGENYIQELKEKQPQLPEDIEWHFIGHLQTNKVKDIAAFVHLIHSVDSLRLLQEINKRAKQQERIINCLLQFHIAEEQSKTGMDLVTALEILNSEEFKKLDNVNIVGVMGMSTFTNNKGQVKSEFQRLKAIFDQLKSDFFADKSDFAEISMGMSGDYELAIEEGSTIVRVGSLLFGARV